MKKQFDKQLLSTVILNGLLTQSMNHHMTHGYAVGPSMLLAHIFCTNAFLKWSSNLIVSDHLHAQLLVFIGGFSCHGPSKDSVYMVGPWWGSYPKK